MKQNCIPPFMSEHLLQKTKFSFRPKRTSELFADLSADLSVWVAAYGR